MTGRFARWAQTPGSAAASHGIRVRHSETSTGTAIADLYVAGYVALSALNLDADAPVCNYRSIRGFCGPKGLAGEPDILYRNVAGEKFADVTEEAHVTDKNLSHGFTVVFDDFNGDGKTRHLCRQRL